MSKFDQAPIEICGSIGRQVDLLMTLALAITAGIAAAALQIALNNTQTGVTPIDLSGLWLVYAGLVSQGVAILLGYLARNALVQATPGIFAFDWNSSAKLSKVKHIQPFSFLRDSVHLIPSRDRSAVCVC